MGDKDKRRRSHGKTVQPVGYKSLKGGRSAIPQTRDESHTILRQSWECCNVIDALQTLGKTKVHGLSDVAFQAQLSEHVTTAALKDLRKEGLVAKRGTGWKLTQTGRKARTS